MVVRSHVQTRGFHDVIGRNQVFPLFSTNRIPQVELTSEKTRADHTLPSLLSPDFPSIVFSHTLCVLPVLPFPMNGHLQSDGHGVRWKMKEKSEN